MKTELIIVCTLSVILCACDPITEINFLNSGKDTMYVAYKIDSMGLIYDYPTEYLFRFKQPYLHLGHNIVYQILPSEKTVFIRGFGAGLPNINPHAKFFYAYKKESTDTLFFNSFRNLNTRITKKKRLMGTEYFVELNF
jgi:hypothetical protein